MPEETAPEAEPASSRSRKAAFCPSSWKRLPKLLERCDTLLNTWRDKLSDQKLVQNLQREIHTFKGGARMAGLDPLGNLSHAMETSARTHRRQPDAGNGRFAVQALEEGCDRLNRLG